MIGPPITKSYKANFETLRKACANGDLALVSCRWKATHKPVVVICAMQTNSDKTITPVPMATMFDGNPFELLEDPTEDKEG